MMGVGVRKTLFVAGILLLPVAAISGDKMSAKDIKWLKGIDEVTAIGCDSYENSAYSVTQRKNLKIKPSVFKVPRVIDGGALVCDLQADTSDIEQPIMLTRESGVISGVNVAIYHSDGSGTIGKDYNDKKAWESSCNTDAMTDEVTCYVRHKQLYIVKNKDGYFAMVGHEHFPETLAYVRVGGSKPFTSGEGGVFSKEESGKVIDAMSKSDNVVTRYTKWPYESPIDENIEMKYFGVAKQVLDTIYDNHK